MIRTNRLLRVFLCHSSSDKPAVRKLYERLVGDGVDAWLDQEKLIPGQNWQNEITKAVNDTDVVVVCLSVQSVTKEGYVQKEIKFALDKADEKPEGTIFIIPARLENCDVPQRISQFHWVDLFSDGGYERLIKALRIRAESLGTIIKPEKSSATPEHEPLDFLNLGGDINKSIFQVIKSAENNIRPQKQIQKRHPKHPNVVASSEEGKWRPASGYKFINDVAGDFRVQWQPGKKHSEYPNVVASSEEGMWEPASGYKFINDVASDFRVQWQPGKKHSEYPNVVASSEEGKWEPSSGYKFINDVAGDFRVQWQPGKKHSEYPNVVASSEEGKWEPRSGYTWVDAQSRDLRVISKNSA